MGQEAEETQPVVDGDHHHVARRGPGCRPGRGRPSPIPDTKDPPWTQTITGRRSPSRPGVQTLRLRQSSDCSSGSAPEGQVDQARGLGGDGPEPVAEPDPGPRLGGVAGGRNRRRSGRRGGIGDAGERPEIPAADPLHPAAPDLDHSVHDSALQFDGRAADTTSNLPSWDRQSVVADVTGAGLTARSASTDGAQVMGQHSTSEATGAVTRPDGRSFADATADGRHRLA